MALNLQHSHLLKRIRGDSKKNGFPVSYAVLTQIYKYLKISLDLLTKEKAQEKQTIFDTILK